MTKEMTEEMTDNRPNQKYPFTVSLTRIADGKTVEIKDEWGYSGYIRGDDWETDCVHIWVDGNNSDDCSRASNFAHAAGEPEPEDQPCGDLLFKLNWIRNDETGRVVYE